MKQNERTYSNELAQEFRDRFGHPPTFTVSAPGRVNLIGEHTDYNEGYVFPAAIDRYIRIAASKRTDRQVHLHALDLNESCTFSLDTHDNGLPAWSRYLKGVSHLLQEQVLQPAGYTLGGMSAVITGNVPLGAGLSSSAALSVAATLAFLGTCDLEIARLPSRNPASGAAVIDLPPIEVALLCQRVESEYVGVNCGIMDQTISLLGKANHALFLDCRSLEYKHVPLELGDAQLVICNTNVKRELAASAYNQRRAECENGVEILKKQIPAITSLRDVAITDFKKYEEKLPENTQKRCRYVIEENERVQNAVHALTSGDIETFGRLMNASHIGLRDAYEVSCDELNLLTDIAQSIDGVIGARMTGAGFGGCTVNIVREAATEPFREQITTEYTQNTGIKPDIYFCNVGDGARIQW